MFTDQGGWLWFVIDVVLVGALAFGLAYGLYMWRTRRTTARLEQQRDEATRAGYEQGSGESRRV